MPSVTPKFIVISFESKLYVAGKFVAAGLLAEPFDVEPGGLNAEDEKIADRTFNSPFLENLDFAGAYDDDTLDLELDPAPLAGALSNHVWIRRRFLVWTLTPTNFRLLHSTSPTNAWIINQASRQPHLRGLSFAGAWNDDIDDPFVAGGGHGP